VNDVPLLIQRAALEQRVDQGPEVLRLTSDSQGPRVTSVRKHPRDSLETINIVFLNQISDARSELEHPRQKNLNCIHALVHILGLPAHHSKTLSSGLKGVVV
jgi:hypothetical protein